MNTDIKGTVTQSAATAKGTDPAHTTAMSKETAENSQTTTEQGSLSTTRMSPEMGSTLTTLNIQRENTTSSSTSADETVTAGGLTPVTNSDTKLGHEQTFLSFLDSTKGPVSLAQDNGLEAPIEVTSIAVLSEGHEEPSSTLPHEITEQTTQTVGPPKGTTETTVFTETSTEKVPATEESTESVPPLKKATGTLAPTEQPTGRVTLTEQPTQTVPIETSIFTEQPAEMAIWTKQLTAMLAETEQLFKTTFPIKREVDAVTQTEQSTEMPVATGQPTETAKHTEPEDTVTHTEQHKETTAAAEQPAHTVTQTEQTETVESTEEQTETMTTNARVTVSSALPDWATEQITSTETDSRDSTVATDELPIQSTSRFRKVRKTRNATFPLAYELSSPTASENATLETSNRTRRSIEGTAFYVLRYILLPLSKFGFS
jgi:hypothetical protein